MLLFEAASQCTDIVSHSTNIIAHRPNIIPDATHLVFQAFTKDGCNERAIGRSLKVVCHDNLVESRVAISVGLKCGACDDDWGN